MSVNSTIDNSKMQFSNELIEETQRVLEEDYRKPFTAEETNEVLSFYVNMFMCLEEAKRKLERG